MATHPTSLRPSGFRPSEISALVNRPVVQEHASEAAFLWRQRELAVRAPHYKLKHLAKLDARLVAHLRGLEAAADEGWSAAQEGLGELTAPVLFVASYLAFASRDSGRMYQALQLGLTAPDLEAALVAALAWLDPLTAAPAIHRLCASPAPHHRRIGVAALVADREAADLEIERAAGDPDSSVRAIGLRGIGECKRLELIDIARAALRDPDPVCRFWAGWSVAVHGDAAGARVAFDAGVSVAALRLAALEIAMRGGEAGWARGIIRSLAGSPQTHREAIVATGFFGDPATVPWLLGHAGDPVHARIAGEALANITGVDLEYADLTADPPDAAEAVDDGLVADEGLAPEAMLEEDADLPWPDPDAVRAWWSQHRSRFADGRRHLCGEPASAGAAARVLREGYQRQRTSAAIELAIHSPTAPVFPVLARADWQQRRLSS